MPTITLTGFTAEDPATAQSDIESVAAADGKTVTLHVVAADPITAGIVEGAQVAATAMDDTTLALDLDLTGQNVDAMEVTADFAADSNVGNLLSITAFSAENPTVCTLDPASTGKVADGDYVTLDVTVGDLPQVDGQTQAVSNVTDTSFTVPIDLSITDTTGAMGTAVVVEAPAPAPPPIPEPGAGNHFQASMSPGTTTIWHPSPGQGGTRVEENPEDTAPGTSRADEVVPDPDAPLAKTLTNAAAKAKYDALRMTPPPMPPEFPPGP